MRFMLDSADGLSYYCLLRSADFFLGSNCEKLACCGR
jgi:hypothetical protein